MAQLSREPSPALEEVDSAGKSANAIGLLAQHWAGRNVNRADRAWGLNHRSVSQQQPSKPIGCSAARARAHAFQDGLETDRLVGMRLRIARQARDLRMTVDPVLPGPLPHRPVGGDRPAVRKSVVVKWPRVFTLAEPDQDIAAAVGQPVRIVFGRQAPRAFRVVGICSSMNTLSYS